jgi:hypothetical protein
MKVSEIQQAIFEQTGLKTSFKKMTGSMKYHVKIWPIFQGGKYPSFSFEWANEFKKQFKPDLAHDCFPYGSISEINIPAINFTEIDPISYKKEAKPKPIDESKVMKGWGSKNSQMRLDKATARNAVKLRAGTTARYY